MNIDPLRYIYNPLLKLFANSIHIAGIAVSNHNQNSHFYFLMCIYFEKERESEQGGAERAGVGERERIPSSLHTVNAEPRVGLEPMNAELLT